MTAKKSPPSKQPTRSASQRDKGPSRRDFSEADKSLRQHVVYMLKESGAHITFEHAIANLAADLQGRKPPGAAHSVWELLEHLRLAQRDILEFSRDPQHVSPEWPSGYWPTAAAPPNQKAWKASVEGFQKDLLAMQKLVANPSTDLFARIPHGDGQTILREALLVADHNAYHVGQIVHLRRMLDAWPL